MHEHAVVLVVLVALAVGPKPQAWPQELATFIRVPRYSAHHSTLQAQMCRPDQRGEKSFNTLILVIWALALPGQPTFGTFVFPPPQAQRGVKTIDSRAVPRRRCISHPPRAVFQA